MFKVVTIGSDGSREEDDESFETEAEAQAHVENLCDGYTEGAEILHLSNPGDYPDPDDELDFEVIEVDD